MKKIKNYIFANTTNFFNVNVWTEASPYRTPLSITDLTINFLNNYYSKSFKKQNIPKMMTCKKKEINRKHRIRRPRLSCRRTRRWRDTFRTSERLNRPTSELGIGCLKILTLPIQTCYSNSVLIVSIHYCEIKLMKCKFAYPLGK